MKLMILLFFCFLLVISFLQLRSVADIYSRLKLVENRVHTLEIINDTDGL